MYLTIVTGKESQKAEGTYLLNFDGLSEVHNNTKQMTYWANASNGN